MAIRIKGMSDDSHLAQVASLRYKDSVMTGEIPCEADVYSHRAFLGYYSSGRSHRPYLCLMGEVRSIRGSFPQNIQEVVLDEPLDVAFIYEFSGNELADMCRKGLFTDGFKCPDIFENNSWNGLPIDSCRYKIVPGDQESAPIVFVGINEAFNLPLDRSCGYVAGNYFEAVPGYNPDYLDSKDKGLQSDVDEPAPDDMEDAFSDYPMPDVDEPVIDEAVAPEAAGRPIQQLESLESMDNSVIMANPHLRAAYQEMQGKVKAKLEGRPVDAFARQSDGESAVGPRPAAVNPGKDDLAGYEAERGVNDDVDEALDLGSDEPQADAGPEPAQEPAPQPEPVREQKMSQHVLDAGEIDETLTIVADDNEDEWLDEDDGWIDEEFDDYAPEPSDEPADESDDDMFFDDDAFDDDFEPVGADNLGDEPEPAPRREPKMPQAPRSDRSSQYE